MSDLISRQAAIDELEYAAWGKEWDKALAKAMLESLPAQPERKKGKWIRHSIGHENTPWGFDCSVCGKWFVIGEDTAEQYNYCPNCGAEMRGENE